MKFADLITKKIKNEELNFNEVKYIVENYSNNQINDKEMTKLIDAFLINPMTEQETIDFFDVTYQKSQKVDLRQIKNFKIDKHSTGGVGDKVSLLLLPILDALGLKSYKFSAGRLGFTGGTIEKLKSFPNIELEISAENYMQKAKENNILLTSGIEEMSYFEKKLYHLRNVTQKNNVLGMVVNSVMIKKMILNNDGLIIDVKVGSGAFFKTFKEGLQFAELAAKIANKYDRKFSFIITDMNEPLGENIGNKLEIIEVINFFKNKQTKDLKEIVIAHVHEALLMSKKTKSLKETKSQVEKIIKNGKALEKFRQFVEKQNGDFDFIYKNQEIKTKNKIEIKSWQNGYINIIDTSKIGSFVNQINVLNNNKIDYESGVQLFKKNGDFVGKNELIAIIWTNQKNTNLLESQFKKLINIDQKQKIQVSKIKKIIKNF